MKTIRCESPTRVDLAGGTLDLWPLYLFVGESHTVNFAIDIKTSVELTPATDSRIFLESVDQGRTQEFHSLDELLSSNDDRWCLVRAHARHWKPNTGFHLKTHSMSPVGAGLGGSSSLSISLIKAFSTWARADLSSEEMVRLAGNLEAQVLHTPTGTQDYYPPIHGGMNLIFYGCDGRKLDVIDLPTKEFEKNFFLVYTGRPHHSGLNNWEVVKSVIEKDGETLSHLKSLKGIAEEVKNVCERRAWSELGPFLERETEHRIALSAAITCPEIEKLRVVAREAGADAVKICGAGGGGCALVWVSPDKHDSVKRKCVDSGFEILDAHLVPALDQKAAQHPRPA